MQTLTRPNAPPAARGRLSLAPVLLAVVLLAPGWAAAREAPDPLRPRVHRLDARIAPPVLDALADPSAPRWEPERAADWNPSLHVTPAGTVLKLQAHVGGIPVLDAVARVHFDAGGAPTHLVGPTTLPAPAPQAGLAVTEPPPAGARRIWFADREGLVPAYLLAEESDGLGASASERRVIAAGDGAVLDRRRSVASFDAFEGEGLVFDPNPVVTSGDRSLHTGIDVDPWRVRVRLHDLDGSGLLRGAWACVANPAGCAYDQRLEFFYSSRDLHFEEVMAYHHITEAQRYIRNLGFLSLNGRPQPVTVHATGEDASWFSLADKRIYLGDGGVDAAEDADVILHEYAHALYDAVVGPCATAQSWALNEGFADYFAASLTGDACVGDWEGTYQTGGCLRDLDVVRLYPVDLTGDVYADALVWSSLLWRVRGLIGATLSDRLALEWLYFQTPRSTFASAARGLLAAAERLEATPGSNALRWAVAEALGERGFVPRGGSLMLSSDLGGSSPAVAIGFPWQGPGMAADVWADSVRITPEGRILLGLATLLGRPSPAAEERGPQVAPLALARRTDGAWPHDRIDVSWSGTLTGFEIEVRFVRGEQILRRTAVAFHEDGRLHMRWFGEGDQEALAGTLGWFPSGLEGPIRWLEAPALDAGGLEGGQGVGARLPPSPLSLVGGEWLLVPASDGGYEARLTVPPWSPTVTRERRRLALAGPARLTDRIGFRIETPGAHDMQLIDLTGRSLGRLRLGELQPGFHEVPLERLFGTSGARAGIYFLRLSSDADTRTGRLLVVGR